MTAVGIASDDYARVFVDTYAYSTTLGMGDVGRYDTNIPLLDELADGPLLTASRHDWPATLDLTFDFSGERLTTMTATLYDSSGYSGPFTFQLCVPDADIGCDEHWRQTVPAPATGSSWQTTFTPLVPTNELPLYGVVRVLAEDEGEIIRWFQVAGGVGPGHENGEAPMGDGPAQVLTMARAAHR
jgi:hypothetical protein